MRIVDQVVVYDTVSVDVLKEIEFDILALGEDHRGPRFDVVEKWCRDNDKQIVRLKRTEGISSTSIKEELRRDL